MAAYIPPSRAGECSSCGKKVQITWTSSQTPTCRDCIKARPTYRSKHRKWTPEPRVCRTCGADFIAKRPTQIYCTPDHRPRAAWRDKPRNPDKYGRTHTAARRQWAKQLEQVGQLPCSLCGEPVYAGSTWHLDHVPNTNDQYRGVAHPHCNMSEGAKRGVQIANRSPKRQRRDSIPLTLASGRTVDVQMKTCESCGKTCFGKRCKPCADVVRALAKRKVEPQRALLTTCTDCGALHDRRSGRCARCTTEANRTKMREKYRAEHGIPLDAPLYSRDRSPSRSARFW